jgi:hypothetical protein
LTGGEGATGHGQDEDREVGRIDLAVGRVGAQAGRQVGACGVDRRLHIARGAIDVAAYAEHQDDAGLTERARGGHLGDIGDLAEVSFERSRHRGRHGLGTGAWHRCRHQDDREIDLRQRSNREQEEGHRPQEHHGQGQQGGGYRPSDTDLGKRHPPAIGSATVP